MQSSPDPIPSELRTAFRAAVWSYADWNPAQPEPQVQVGGSAQAISAVCGLVDKFQDHLRTFLRRRRALFLKIDRGP